MSIDSESWADHCDGVLNRPSKMQIDFNVALVLLPTLEEVNTAIKSQMRRPLTQMLFQLMFSLIEP